MDALLNKYKFNLKKMGPISSHPGCDFFRVIYADILFPPQEHIDKMLQYYMNMFGKNPKLRKSIIAPL